MPISATDPPEASLTVFDGTDWVMAREDGAGVRMLLAPGEKIAIHWLELAEGLTEAQAAGAARLMLADASADPLADMHVAVGRPEAGLTPVALVSVERMREWVATDPDIILPSPFLIPPPETGLVRRDARPVPDYRGLAVAFSAEPEIAAMLIGDTPVEPADELALEYGLNEALENPAINLRQGAFARRRQWKVDSGRARRVALLVAGLLVVTLVLQLATIMRYNSEAERMETEAAALGPGARARPAFGALAPLLWEAVRSTPNLELTRVEWRGDGSLAATVAVDSPATLAAFRARAEASGVAIEGGALQNAAGGRPTAELVLRPA